MKRVTAVLLLTGTLAGCASTSESQSPWLVQRDLSPARHCEPLTADQELVLGLSQEMATARRWHAALANLERLPNDIPQVRLSKARLLRLLGHSDEAETLYSSLLQSCLAADAQHGLGQIAAGRSNYAKAQEHLRVAASQSPANDSIRNDLGVVYLNQRQLSEARFELLTAMELNENTKRAAQNMLTLLLYEGNWESARQLVSARGLSSEDFKRAEQRAQGMRNEDAVAPATMPAMVAQPLATPEPAGTAAAVATLGTPAAPVASAPRVHSVASAPVAAPVTAQAPVTAPPRAPIRVSAAAAALGTAPATTAPVPTRATPVRVSEAAAVLGVEAATAAPAPATRMRVADAAAELGTNPAATATAPVSMPLAVAARAWAAEQPVAADGAATQGQSLQQAPAAEGRSAIVCRSSGASGARLAVMECLPE